MAAAAQAALADPALRRQLAERGTTPRGGPPEAYGSLVAAELERWRQVVQTASIRPD
jgi:tripartite-type tricarboxylate transporter receptor subunit TctC